MSYKIKDYGPSTASHPIVSNKKVGYLESMTRFGKVHEYLIKVGILDGSSNSLVEDLVDTKISDKEAIDMVMERIKGVKSTHSQVEKLVYIALGGVFKLEISMRIRKALSIQHKELVKARSDEDFDIAYSLIKGDKSEITEDDLVRALEMRINAIQSVARLHGPHFLKRAYHVSKGWKIPLADVRHVTR